MGFWQNPSINSLAAELFDPGCDALDDPTKFADIQRKRVAAQKAWINADSHAKLRRAMNKIFQEVKADVQIGQKVWFWRKAGTGILQKAMWRRGPARVVVIYAAFAFLFVILLFTIYMIAELITPKDANYQIGNRDVVGQSTQTERGGETNIATITYDEQMQLGAYIGQLEGRLDKYKGEIQANLADYVDHIVTK